MSMLAGPRHKQKVINLRAKNNAWSNDSSKFGQRMLEKMGWSTGKGLGAKEDGIVEHVIARYKNDEKGLGFKDTNDQWTKHEDDFNALLSNLTNDSANNIDTRRSVSLEMKSKTSKSRVHYHKFTRCKDISRYTEKDLANIFGKKSLKPKKENLEKEDATSASEEVKITNRAFKIGGNMEDYFKSKLVKTKSSDISNCKYKEISIDDDADEIVHHGFGFQSLSPNTITKNNEKSQSLHVAPKLKKNNKKDKDELIDVNKINKKKKKYQIEEAAIPSDAVGIIIKKTKNRTSNKRVDMSKDEPNYIDHILDESPRKKKKKKK